jgi:hypothetical protein
MSLSGWDTKATWKNARVARGAPRRLLIAVAGIVIVLVLASLTFWWVLSLLSERTPDQIVEDFREAGLDVGESYPLDEEANPQPSLLPQTYEEAVRFVIPALGVDSEGQDQGGRVFSFESEEDLAVVRNHYESAEQIPIFGPSLHSHVYEDGLILVQINGQLPKKEADRYGKVLQEES